MMMLRKIIDLRNTAENDNCREIDQPTHLTSWNCHPWSRIEMESDIRSRGDNAQVRSKRAENCLPPFTNFTFIRARHIIFLWCSFLLANYIDEFETALYTVRLA